MNYQKSPMEKSLLETGVGRFFWKVIDFSKTIITLGVLTILVFAAFIPQMTKDTSSEAFVPDDHPSVVYGDKVKAIFGLADPVVIAVINDGPTGVFNPHSLSLVSWLTEHVKEVPGVDPERITSLATENNIIGTSDGMLVEPFFEEPPATQQEADDIRAAVMDFPLYVGSLAAPDGQGTLVVAELLDENKGSAVYADILALAAQAPVKDEEIHVAGEGAAKDYLGTYIDIDMQRMNPLAGLIITLMLFVAYRTLRGVLLPNLVLVGAVAVSLGGMAAAGVPFYVITNTLPVVLIAVGVADGIHILGQYYEELAQRPTAPQRELVVRSMVEMWRPVTITSVTDMAGFVAISFASDMPPMFAFGLFASLGVLTAWLFSLFVIPAVLALLSPKLSPAFRPRIKGSATDTPAYVDQFGRMMGTLGRWVTHYPRYILTAAAMIAVAGLFGALHLEVNEGRIENFQPYEPIYRADRIINQVLDGTNYLDIVIETPEPEDLFNPDHLQRIGALQAFFETLPHVKGTTSIVDYLKQMNRSLNEGRTEEYRLPEDADLIAQYFLLYSATGDPTDFEKEIDYDYRLANVRVTMDSGLYSDMKVVIEAGERYIQKEFNALGITATLAGRVNIIYHWISGIGRSHFKSLILALIFVWGMSAFSFRSAVAGVLAIIPLSMAVLLIYAVMGLTGIWLRVSTSMFAAIAIGVSVDFAIHVLDRLIVLVRDEGRSLEEAFPLLFPATGRALLFNFLCLWLGFGVLTVSQTPRAHSHFQGQTGKAER